ncbi:MAG: hypothetical protein ACLFOY_00470 [Desulfatibacillaceae bacterium]
MTNELEKKEGQNATSSSERTGIRKKEDELFKRMTQVRQPLATSSDETGSAPVSFQGLAETRISDLATRAMENHPGLTREEAERMIEEFGG